MGGSAPWQASGIGLGFILGLPTRDLGAVSVNQGIQGALPYRSLVGASA